MRKALIVLAFSTLCLSQTALAVDDGQTQPKNNTAANNSSSTATDLIPTTNGSGNVKGIACTTSEDGSGNIASAVVKFYVNGGAAQTITLHETYQPLGNIGGTVVGYTGWVPLNVRFSSSIRVTIQKSSAIGSGIDCSASWGLD
jgi:hypothetical protein